MERHSIRRYSGIAFDESKHPRGDGGQFASGSGAGSGQSSGLDVPGTTPLNRSIHAALKKNAKPGKELGFGEILRMLPPEISRKDAAAEISRMVDRREIEYTRRGNYKPIISDAAYEHFGVDTKQAPSLKGQRNLFGGDPDPTPAPEAEKTPRIEATRGGQKSLFARARNAARSILGV